MVNNLNSILDEAENKFVGECIMPPNCVSEFIRKLEQAKPVYRAINNDDTTFRPTREQLNEYQWFEQNQKAKDFYIWETDPITNKDWNLISKMMGVEPFRPCVMINISPNWKGRYGEDPLLDEIMKDGFKEVIELYLNSCDRYSKWKYCLESGSEDNFLHAHIVAEINPKMAKSVKTHINKGNHKGELMKKMDKQFKEVKGFEGLLKGKYAVQRIMLNTEELRDDKLNYLLEENKPEGHRNKTDLSLVFGGF